MARDGFGGRRGGGGSGGRDWWEYEETVPREVEGGLTARSTRGAIGTTWWSKRFIAVLESLGAGGRLTRGRAYARKGQVLSLDLVPGIVSGTVQGSRPQPYEVWITMPVLKPAVWKRVEAAIGDQALFAAELLGGELPAELESVVASAGGSLFPSSFSDLTMRCTCPDWGMPCKHLAAAFYLLAETFDDDPFRILLWRGRGRDQLLAGIRGVADAAGAAGAAGAPGAAGTLPVGPVSAGRELAELPATAASEMLDRFWVSPVPLPPRPTALDAAPDLLLRQMPGPPATLGGAGLATTLDDAYRRLTRPEDPPATDE
jgi:uncharacterized Zn finger protein